MSFLPTQQALQYEEALKREAESWAAPSDYGSIPIATEEEVPVIDVGPFLRANSDLEETARQIRDACRSTGFYYIVNHLVSPELIDKTFQVTRWFHDLPQEIKMRYEMGSTAQPPGVGYLPLNNYKLPARAKGNVNESFIVKREIGPRNITLDRMPWPQSGNPSEDETFRDTILRYLKEMESLSQRMLPLYAVALGLSSDYFQGAFKNALFRFRMTHYPPVSKYEDSQYGIGPHVDTSFFTILASSSMGLVVHSKRTNGWIMVGARQGCLVVNTGQLLQQITNDSWMAVKHLALNAGSVPRYSLTFFLNANPTFKMPVVPTCVSENNPAKYPPASYLEGQGVAQGE